MSETPEEARRRLAGFPMRATIEPAELIEDVDGAPAAVTPAVYAYGAFDADGEILGGWETDR